MSLDSEIEISLKIPEKIYRQLAIIARRNRTPVKDFMTEVCHDFILNNYPKEMERRKHIRRRFKIPAMARIVEPNHGSGLYQGVIQNISLGGLGVAFDCKETEGLVRAVSENGLIAVRFRPSCDAIPLTFECSPNRFEVVGDQLMLAAAFLESEYPQVLTLHAFLT